MKILVDLIGLSLIGFVYWFFFMKKDTVQQVVGHTIRIKVSGGYQPNTIKAPVNKPITIIFDRQDPSSCLEEVTIPAFEIRQFLPLGKATSVTLSPTRVGTFDIVCGMNMQHAKLIVEAK